MSDSEKVDSFGARLTTTGKILANLLRHEKSMLGVELTRDEVQSLCLILLGDDPDCESCRNNLRGGIAPTHNGSKGCESGSIASGGKNAHCTCDVCF